MQRTSALRKEDGLSVYDRLAALKIQLQEVTPPVAAFLPFTRVGRLVNFPLRGTRVTAKARSDRVNAAFGGQTR